MFSVQPLPVQAVIEQDTGTEEEKLSSPIVIFYYVIGRAHAYEANRDREKEREVNAPSPSSAIGRRPLFE